SYGKTEILRDISFSITEGESVGLVGMNGAGKSTLIKCILDFVSIKSGNIQIFSQQHLDTDARNTLAFLPEKFLPPYYLTGRNFINYMAELYNITIEEDAIELIFKILDLELSALHKPVRQYSKGMAQKLGLAACFLSDRPLFILDEPMSGLDPKARAFLKDYLLQLKEKGKTLFFSTHLLNDVESLCDRIIILHHGMLCFNGSLQACCEHYQVQTLEQAYLANIEQAEAG
ncbi:MAG: ABC transporter ATP-binding protein, partial [Pseudomonadota bacterium]